MAKRRKSRKHAKKSTTKGKKPSYKVVCGKKLIRSRMRRKSTAKKVRARAAKRHSSCKVIKC